MANWEQERNIPAQQGNERSDRGIGSEERSRGEEEVRGVGDEADEEFEDTDDLDDEEEETDEGSF